MRVSLLSKNPMWLLLVMLFSLSLVGCGDDGDDGAQGPIGPPGPPGPPTEVPTELHAAFTNAAVAEDGSLTVSFVLEDEGGRPYVGLTSASFAVVQLLPEGATGTGDNSRWQSYINRVESAPTDPANGPGTEDQNQATTERDGTLVDHQDGSYSYTYSTNLMSVTSPVEVTYNSALTHRVALQISGGGLPTANATHDWQPETGAVEGIDQRNIVQTETCNTCHNELAFHGGGRVDTNYCVTCHNPGSTDANSGNTLAFNVMVHKIHRGAHLPSVEAGGEYAIWGYRDSKHDYSDVAFPQDIRNCSNCHNDENAATPQASNWYLQPTMESCGSCHDDIDFTVAGTAPNGHAGGPQADNAQCSTCHGVNGGFPVGPTHEGALANAAMGAEDLVITIDAARLDAATKDLEVDLTITLGGTGVASFADIAPFIKTGAGYLMVNWDDGTGYQFAYSSPEGGFKPAGNTFSIADCTADGAGKFTCLRPNSGLASFGDTGTIALTVAEMPLCTNEKSTAGELIDCATPDSRNAKVGVVALNPPLKFFNMDGTIASNYSERVGADRDSCNGCHADLSIHITSHAAKEFAQCKSCHNATKAAFYDGRPGDLKSHVHTLHANSDSVHGGDLRYPGDISNCLSCHTEDQYDIPPAQNSRASKANAGAGAVAFVSPTAVVCSSCHITLPVGLIDPAMPGDVSAYAAGQGLSLSSGERSLIDHMVSNGAVFASPDFDSADKVESCAVCHSKGGVAGIDAAHGLAN